MRFTIFAFLLALLAIPPATSAQAEKVRCSAIRDSAMCVSEPSCWYDAVNNKGCLDGPRPAENRCAVHRSQSTCDTSSLGCMWSADEDGCVPKN